MPQPRQFHPRDGLSPSPLTRSALAWMVVTGAIALAAIGLEPTAPTAATAATKPAPAGEEIPTIVIVGKRERTPTPPRPTGSSRGSAS